MWTYWISKDIASELQARSLCPRKKEDKYPVVDLATTETNELCQKEAKTEMSNGEVCGSIVKMQHIRWILLQLAGKSPFDRTINPIHPSVVNRLNIQTSACSIET